jgi:hypothetical protein
MTDQNMPSVNQKGDRIAVQEGTRGEERRGEQRRREESVREEKKGDERIPISLFHVRSVLLVDLASVSYIRFSADSKVG